MRLQITIIARSMKPLKSLHFLSDKIKIPNPFKPGTKERKPKNNDRGKVSKKIVCPHLD